MRRPASAVPHSLMQTTWTAFGGPRPSPSDDPARFCVIAAIITTFRYTVEQQLKRSSYASRSVFAEQLADLSPHHQTLPAAYDSSHITCSVPRCWSNSFTPLFLLLPSAYSAGPLIDMHVSYAPPIYSAPSPLRTPPFALLPRLDAGCHPARWRACALRLYCPSTSTNVAATIPGLVPPDSLPNVAYLPLYGRLPPAYAAPRPRPPLSLRRLLARAVCHALPPPRRQPLPSRFQPRSAYNHCALYCLTAQLTPLGAVHVRHLSSTPCGALTRPAPHCSGLGLHTEWAALDVRDAAFLPAYPEVSIPHQSALDSTIFSPARNVEYFC
ncbi:hypothetical protein HYPSUDRAFT_206564 [Hypholoma sublateritium FD-334 SS-4]|uniref:Uncharacterized protein n=1 Tax=Hypholoma sublateritium (strain FD-334 SS-4) TaxID=945553 RepID=A0A0D2ND31_HYPSF|nr:hypothetical protein HYPSUDRAFT_206564 [Hypholoma sublateritium FD-334 SS-4]